MLASLAVFGIDADLSTAIAAIVGPLVAVFLAVIVGLWQFKIQQQSQHASQRFITDGVQKLSGALGTLISIHHLNFQISTYIIRALTVHDSGDQPTPGPDDLPEFLGLKIESLPFDSVLPVQELIGDKVVLDWTMHAISDVTLEAKELNFLLRQPVAAYFRGDTDWNVGETVRRMKAVRNGWNDRIAPHTALLDRLYKLEGQLVLDRPTTAKDYFTVWKRSEIKKIRDEMIKGYEIAMTALRESEPVLKSGGAASGPE